MVKYPNLCYSEDCYFYFSESCYKGTILQRDYRKMTIHGHFPNNSFVKFYGKNWEPQHVQICVIMRSVMKGLHVHVNNKCCIQPDMGTCFLRAIISSSFFRVVNATSIFILSPAVTSIHM